MSEGPVDTTEADESGTAGVGTSQDSMVWKYLGGLGLGVCVPMLLIAMSTVDKPETPESEPGQIWKFALPIALISLSLCYLDQIRSWVRKPG